MTDTTELIDPLQGEKPKRKPKKPPEQTEVQADVLDPIDPKLPRTDQEVAALARVAKTSARVDAIEGDLAKARREWNELVAKRKVALKALIEGSGGLPAEQSGERLVQITVAQQEVDEAESGRKVALAEVLTTLKRGRKLYREALENASQLELFGGPGMTPQAIGQARTELDGEPAPAIPPVPEA